MGLPVVCGLSQVFLVTKLSSTLKKVANHQISRRSVRSAVIASISSARSDGATDNASSSIQLSQLGNAFWRCPPRFQLTGHEAVVQVSNFCLRVQATLGALQEHSSRLVPWSLRCFSSHAWHRR